MQYRVSVGMLECVSVQLHTDIVPTATDCNLKAAYSAYKSIMRLVLLYILISLQNNVSNLKFGGL